MRPSAGGHLLTWAYLFSFPHTPPSYKPNLRRHLSNQNAIRKPNLKVLKQRHHATNYYQYSYEYKKKRLASNENASTISLHHFLITYERKVTNRSVKTTVLSM